MIAPTDRDNETRAPEPQRAPGEIVRGWVRRALPWMLLSFAVWLVLRDLTHGPLVDEGPAPPLVASLADGSQFDLEDRAGDVVVLNFWATWCPPCRAEAPSLTRIHNRLAEHGGMVLGIANDAMPLGEILPRARALGMEYPIAQTDQATWDWFHVTQLPTTYVVARDGTIVWSHVGAVNEQRLTEVVLGL